MIPCLCLIKNERKGEFSSSNPQMKREFEILEDATEIVAGFGLNESEGRANTWPRATAISSIIFTHYREREMIVETRIVGELGNERRI